MTLRLFWLAGLVRAGLQPSGGVPGGVREDVASGHLQGSGPEAAPEAGPQRRLALPRGIFCRYIHRVFDAT